MLFRLVKAHPETKDDTLLGWKWIEVLAIQAGTARRRKDMKGQWLWHYTNEYVCRTETGIIVLAEGDLMPEIEEGIYVEAPRCPHCQMTELLEQMPVVVFDEDHKSLKSVVSACQNGDAIQLNVERWEENDDAQ